MEIIPEAFSLLYPQAFIRVINSLDSPDNMLTNNVLYPSGTGTSVGKDKHGLSIGSAKVKHERNAIMQHRASHAPVFKLHPVQLPVEPPLVSSSFPGPTHLFIACVMMSEAEYTINQ